MHRCIITSAHRCIRASMHQFIGSSVQSCICACVQLCICPSKHQFIGASVDPRIAASEHRQNPYIVSSLHLCSGALMNQCTRFFPSIDQCIFASLYHFFDASGHRFIRVSVHPRICASVHPFIRASLNRIIGASVHRGIACIVTTVYRGIRTPMQLFIGTFEHRESGHPNIGASGYSGLIKCIGASRHRCTRASEHPCICAHCPFVRVCKWVDFSYTPGPNIAFCFLSQNLFFTYFQHFFLVSESNLIHLKLCEEAQSYVVGPQHGKGPVLASRNAWYPARSPTTARDGQPSSPKAQQLPPCV